MFEVVGSLVLLACTAIYTAIEIAMILAVAIFRGLASMIK